jgi:HPt (histidine-containing phosphotransfer) domain-containing protein
MKTEHMPGTKISYNLSGLNGLEEKHEQFLNEMIRLFIKSTVSGMQEMQDALKEKDWKKVGDKAHKILGPCKHLEVMPLTNTLKTIENNIFELRNTDEVPSLVKQAKEEAEETIKVFEKLISK